MTTSPHNFALPFEMRAGLDQGRL